MRLEEQGESLNIEDRRGGDGGIGRGSIGIGTLLVALAAGYFFGVDPAVILGLGVERQPLPCHSATRAKATGQRRDGAFRRQGTRQYRGHLAQHFRRGGAPLPGTEAGIIHRRHPNGMRHGTLGDGPLLLSIGSEGLYRPGILPRPPGTLPRSRRICAGLRHCPRSRSSRAAPARHFRQGARGATT
jgi:hypothetical protein